MKISVAYTLEFTVLVALAWGSTVRADKTDFRVNDDGGVREQSHPSIAVAGDGGFVIVWVDKRDANNDVYLQRFDSNGDPMGRNLRINDDDIGAYQSEPVIAADMSGLYSLVWKDYRNSSYPFDPDIFFQNFDSAVMPVGSNRNLTTEWPDSLKETPDIAMSPWGGGVVVWADYRDYNWDIYGQLISGDGSLIGANFKVNDDDNSAQQHAPAVSVAPQGWFVVAWYDNRRGSDDIIVQRFDSDGASLGPNLLVNSDLGGARQAYPDVAADGSGHFTVVWVDWRNAAYPANPDIYARKLDSNMIPLTQDVRVNRDGTTRAQREPTISADRMGNVAVIWSDSTGNSWDINGQMIDVQGVIRETNFQANAEGDSAQLQADVALDGRYRYVAWTDKRNGNWDIYASITKYNEPTLVPFPPTLAFEMSPGGSLPDPQILIIDHGGYNPLNFEVHDDVDWCTVTPTAGLTPDTLSVAVVDDTLPVGAYMGTLMLIDTDNNDSSLTVSIRLDVLRGILSVSPDSIFIQTSDPLSVAETLVVENPGTGALSWNATRGDSWLILEPASGSEGDSIRLSIDPTGLAPGTHLSFVEVTDSNAINTADTVIVELDLLTPLASDTLTFGSINTSVGESFSVPAELVLANEVTELTVPVAFDHTAGTIDSIVFDLSPFDLATTFSEIDRDNGLANLMVSAPSWSPIPRGHYLLANLYLTASDLEGLFAMDTGRFGQYSTNSVTCSGDSATPIVWPGEILIDGSTDIATSQETMLPCRFNLSQNYPNPFNLATQIEFDIPSRAEVTLEVYNVLGQRVTTLTKGLLSVGQYVREWDGKFNNGRVAPSGIYFYRLKSGPVSLVKKMVLVK